MANHRVKNDTSKKFDKSTQKDAEEQKEQII